MKKIQSKITLIYVVLTFVVIVAVDVLSSARMESYFRDRRVADLSSYEDMLVFLLQSEPALSADASDARLKALARVANLRITLIDSSGAVVMDSDVRRGDLPNVENHLRRPEVQAALRQGLGTEIRHSVTVGKDFLYLAKLVDPASARGTLAGVRFIRLSEHLEDVQKAVIEIRRSIFTVGCIVLLLIIAVSAFVSRWVTRPMVQIAKGVEEIRAGNLDTYIPVRTDDEIGRVARAINEMVEHLKQDIARMRRLERVRSEFLGNVSHELRTPIFSLQGFLETLMDGAVDDPRVNRSFLQKAHDHATRLNTLLGDLITISQIESGEMKLSYRYFPVREFLESVVSEFQPVAAQHKVHLTFQSAVPGDVTIYGDKERLSVALGNLLENAIKYNTPDGSVALSCVQEDDRVRVSVSDTGVGIGAEHLPRIFERFYRVDKDRSRDVGGTGLGLAIVKHIVEAHESSVHVESTVGKGSVFSFTLKT